MRIPLKRAFQTEGAANAKALVCGVGAYMWCLRNSKETSVAGAEGILGKTGNVIKEVVGKQIM